MDTKHLICSNWENLATQAERDVLVPFDDDVRDNPAMALTGRSISNVADLTPSQGREMARFIERVLARSWANGTQENERRRAVAGLGRAVAQRPLRAHWAGEVGNLALDEHAESRGRLPMLSDWSSMGAHHAMMAAVEKAHRIINPARAS